MPATTPTPRLNWLQKAGARLTQFGGKISGKSTTIIYGDAGQNFGGVWGSRFSPGSNYDYVAAAGDLGQNSIVSIGLTWITDNFSEPRFVVNRKQGAEWEEQENHALTLLLDANPSQDAATLWAGAVTDLCQWGNGYWRIVRSRGGDPAELWWMPAGAVIPTIPTQPHVPISEYYFNGAKLPAEDVIHFRDRPDPQQPRMGLARLAALRREVATDNEIANYGGSIIRNGGAPGAVLSPLPATGNDPGVEINQEASDHIKARWKATTTGDERGGLVVLTFPGKLDPFGFSPEQMALDKFGARPEARVCAALRIPAMVLGLNVGLERSTYSNYEEARKAAYEDCIIPMQKRFARELARKLLPLLGDPARERAEWDYSEVFTEDEDALSTRKCTEYIRGVAKRGEARGALGYEVDDVADDMYYSAPTTNTATEGGPGTGGQDTAAKSWAAQSRARRLAKERAGLNGKAHPNGALHV